jgi:hypothetical protein
MIKRLSWFLGGAVAGAAGVGAAKRKVKKTAAQMSPVTVAKGAAQRVRDAVAEGRQAMKAKEAELRGRRDGRVSTLADELSERDVVFVDGKPVAAGQVIVLRDVDDLADRRRRKRA